MAKQVKEPPYDIEAERAVLGAMMVNPDAASEIIGTITPETFYRMSHQIIYNAMVSLWSDGVTIDQVSVRDKLKTNNELERIGGPVYLLEISSSTSYTAYNYRRYVEIITRLSVARGLVNAGARITAIGNDMPESVDEGIALSEQTLFEITNKRISDNFASFAELAEEAYARLSDYRNLVNQGVQTGFTDLDDLLGGLRGGELIILAARPSVGKTALALNIAMNAAARDTKVCMFSLEMSSQQIMERVMCSEAEVTLSQLRDPNFRSYEKLMEAGNRIARMNMYIDDTSSISILELSAKAKRHMHGVDGKGLIVVDYLQLMQPANTRDSHQVEVAEISRGLKILAKELDMPVIALSQLSRAVEARKGKHPMLSDLRESGAIEQDADIVMLLDRSTTKMESKLEDRIIDGAAELNVAKHRSGETGVVNLRFDAKFTRFRNMAKGTDIRNKSDRTYDDDDDASYRETPQSIFARG